MSNVIQLTFRLTGSRSPKWEIPAVARYQSALAERVNGILKTELLTAVPQDLQQAATMIDQAVVIYNYQRPHLALKYKTPDEVHRASVALDLRATKKAVARQPI